MGSSLSYLRDRKFALFVIIALISNKLGVFKWLKEKRRAKVLFNRLPTPRLLPGKSETLLLNHAVYNYFLPKTKSAIPTFADIRDNAAKTLTEILNDNPEIVEKGVVNVPILGSIDNVLPINDAVVIIVFGPEKVKEILSAKSMSSLTKGFAYEVSHGLIGDGVLSTSGDVWHTQRKIAEKGFTDEIMQIAMPKVVQTVGELIDRWTATSGKVAYNIHEELLKLTMDVLGRAILSYDFGSVTAKTTDDAPLYNAFNNILLTLDARCGLVLLHWLRWVPSPTNLLFNSSLHKLDSTVKMLVNKRINSTEDRSGKQDLLDVLLDSVRKGEMKTQVVYDNLKTILFAGHDTTGAALSWLLQIIASNADVEEKLLNELDQFFPNRKSGELITPTMKQLESLEYLNSCIQEVLRLYPSAGFTRNIEEEFTFKDGTKLPKGIEVFFFPYFTHRLFYEDGGKFKPERWMQDSKKVGLQARIGLETSKGKGTKYFPFSTGPRNCVGRKLALLEMRVVIINLINSFSFEEVNDPKFRAEPAISMTMVPRSIRLIPKRKCTSQPAV